MSKFGKFLTKVISRKRECSCCVVIPAAGLAVRMGSKNKLLMDLCGEPVLKRTLLAFEHNNLVQSILVSVRNGQTEEMDQLLKDWQITKALPCVEGGSTRLESVYAGVCAVPPKITHVAVHDGARPLISDELISACITAGEKFGAAAPGVSVSDTLKRVDKGFILETVDRDNMVYIQTPQVFDIDILKAALKKAIKKDPEKTTDECMAVEKMGMKIEVVPGDKKNIKITVPEDLPIAEAFLRLTNTEEKK